LRTKLPAKSRNRAVYVTFFNRFSAPNFFQQLIFGDDVARLLNPHAKKIKNSRGQVDYFAVSGKKALIRPQLKAIEPEYRFFCLFFTHFQNFSEQFGQFTGFCKWFSIIWLSRLYYKISSGNSGVVKNAKTNHIDRNSFYIYAGGDA
jgi:hypothetical protein